MDYIFKNHEANIELKAMKQPLVMPTADLTTEPEAG